MVSVAVVTIEEVDCSGSCLQFPHFTGLRSLLATAMGATNSMSIKLARVLSSTWLAACARPACVQHALARPDSQFLCCTCVSYSVAWGSVTFWWVTFIQLVPHSTHALTQAHPTLSYIHLVIPRSHRPYPTPHATHGSHDSHMTTPSTHQCYQLVSQDLCHILLCWRREIFQGWVWPFVGYVLGHVSEQQVLPYVLYIVRCGKAHIYVCVCVEYACVIREKYA